MVFIYEKETGNIKYFYTGNMSQIGWYFKNNPSLVDKWDEYIVEDDMLVISNLHDYRLVVVDGKAITYAKKPKLILNLDKDTIKSDGEDVAVLSIELSDLHPLDRYNKDKNYYLKFNGEQLYKTDKNKIPLSSTDSGLVVSIQGDESKYRTNSVRLEVI